jgi:hypothetical protein
MKKFTIKQLVRRDGLTHFHVFCDEILVYNFTASKHVRSLVKECADFKNTKEEYEKLRDYLNARADQIENREYYNLCIGN